MKKDAIPQAIETENEEVQVLKEESKGHKVLSTVINVILVASIILAAVCTYVSYVSTSGSGVPSLLGLQIFSVQTESMYPTLLPGDLIIDVAVKDTGDLRKDDIITYWTVINGERVLNTHRIHEIYDGGGYLIFATKGDNNTSADPLTVHESEIVGQFKFRIPSVGKFFDYLQTSTGFLLIVVIPVFIFFLFHLVQFFRVLFEYQNVKNRIKYEQERGRTEDLITAQQNEQMLARERERAAIEAELREKLKAELLASMPAAAKQTEAEKAEEMEEFVPEEAEAPAEETPDEQTPVEEVPTEEAPAEETPAEEKPAVMDEAAIEAMIAKQRAAIEAELRQKIMAEMQAKKEEE